MNRDRILPFSGRLLKNRQSARYADCGMVMLWPTVRTCADCRTARTRERSSLGAICQTAIAFFEEITCEITVRMRDGKFLQTFQQNPDMFGYESPHTMRARVSGSNRESVHLAASTYKGTLPACHRPERLRRGNSNHFPRAGTRPIRRWSPMNGKKSPVIFTIVQ